MKFEQFLQGVNAEPMTPQTLTDLAVSMPQPQGWVTVPSDGQQAEFEVIRKNAVQAYQPTATLLVFKLTGADFDVNEALKHAFDMAGVIVEQFNGMPSAKIEATYYEANEQQVHRYNRILIATAKSNQRYLVQFSVATSTDPAQEADPDVLAIIKGFTVAVR